MSSNPVSKRPAAKKPHSEVPFSALPAKTVSQERQPTHCPSPQKGLHQQNISQLKGPLKLHSKTPAATPQWTPSGSAAMGMPRVASTSDSSSDSDEDDEEIEVSSFGWP